jgi:hypothetical protein
MRSPGCREVAFDGAAEREGQASSATHQQLTGGSNLFLQTASQNGDQRKAFRSIAAYLSQVLQCHESE